MFLVQGHFSVGHIFMPPTRRAPEALCFRVVRPPVRMGISLTRNLKNPWVDFYHTWPRGAPWRVDELIRFWARSAQGQMSKVNELGLIYAIFTSLTRNLKNPWVDFHQTWYRGAPPGVDELIRFWARSAQRQRSKVNELGLNMLFSPR